MRDVVIVGRRSSHFTRVPRVVAHALSIPYALEVVRDLTSTDPADYADNPSLKIPALRIGTEVWFGAESVSRRLAEMSGSTARIVWPEDAREAVARNAHEIVWTAMTTQVQCIVAHRFHGLPREHPLVHRLTQSLDGALAWLDAHVDDARDGLPAERTGSLFEIALVCLVEHVELRGTTSLARYPRLRARVAQLGAAAPFAATRYAWDAGPTADPALARE